MVTPILATKLFAPAPRSQAVDRPRLVDELDAGLRGGRRLSLVSAPAGFGKSTLLSAWVAALRARSGVRAAWLSLDEGDNDPARFLAYLSAALHSADPAIGVHAHAGQPSLEAGLALLINEAAHSGQEIVLVLDDFQVIEDAAILDALGFLLDRLPASLHIAIASRSDPLLPVARLRARGELTELRAGELRFTPAEAAEFLNTAMGLSLSQEDVAALETRTEGWIAGLQLAALSMRDRADASAFIAGFAGSNRFVIDYLIEEVLERAPEETRDFLRDTAILDRLSGPLCDAVTGATGGGAMLAALERANLFVVPLDEAREWCRYHHLFADVLRSRLLGPGAERAAVLHARASAWFEHHDALEEAVRHALAAGDLPRAARLIEASIPGVRKSRQDAALLRWLSLLPADTMARRPVLLVFSAWSALVAGEIAAVEPRLVAAERLLAPGAPAHESEPGAELDALPITIALYRAAVALAAGDVPGVTRHASRALELAGPEEHLGRGAAAGLLGLGLWAGGDLEGGLRAFADAGHSLRLAANLTDALSTTMVCADMLVPLGRLGEARRAYESALGEARARLGGGPPTADLHGGFAEVLIELGELAAAEEQLAAAEALGAGAFSSEHRYRWFVSKALLRRAQAQPEETLALLEEAERSYRRGFFAEARPIGAMKARIRIEQGHLPEARAWLDAQGLTPQDELDYLREYSHLTLARLLLAQGDASAGPLLGRLHDAALAGGRLGVVAEIRQLQRQPVAPAGAQGPRLSERELQVLTLLASELSGPEIARALFVSVNTLRTHTRHIFEKLAVGNRRAAVRRARERGLL
ncbi:LuxR C-terminal-related transcriptional regulator [Microterricola viridarii]|uniref:LuxR family transcriptional regulator, maltose regulon positive regulatory protein n=1 Tax=Microterricola viridarii TaxID=412690 RepID=A0A1H1UZE6_9MICO|nr:LuxR C-terminal-related transcriptional regulator [Microterricola viridarii]SDS77835.1 LuxR family transcriptional regulator, maltose regulon positive regulatory protein [Microterricola viridarii]